VVAAVVVAIVGVITWVVVSNHGAASSADPRLGKVSVKGVAAVGHEAPDFALATLDGKTVRLSDFRGKPVVLNFWASWCNPCRDEFPLFRQALAEHHNGFVMLGVDYKDIAGDARDFAKSQHARWPILSDPDSAVATAYGIRAIPQTLFIARDGTISQRIPLQLPSDTFREELAKILAPTAAPTS
jgi:peroxiredoxin